MKPRKRRRTQPARSAARTKQPTPANDEPSRRINGLPHYLAAAPNASLLPPVQTRPQELPFSSLTFENFERLICRFVRTEADVAWTVLYGMPGQAQQGIDVLAHLRDAAGLALYQCKRYRRFTPADLKQVVSTFMARTWPPPPARFVVCVTTSFRTTAAVKMRLEQTQRLKRTGTDLVVWDAEELSTRLKDQPALVDDFFDRAWAEHFCGHEAVARLARMTPERIRELRQRLRDVYASVFISHDPGPPILMRSRPRFIDRYVIPTVEVETSEVHGDMTTDQPAQRHDSADVQRAARNRRAQRTSRQSALSWLSRQHRAIVLGEPGAGKSALARFIALAALDSESERTDFPVGWTDLVPIWLPFGAWARASALGPVSVEDFLRDWFHARSADDVYELVTQVLTDGRVLIIVDGLDEYDTVDAASQAIERLETFLLGRQLPAVLTARPLGYQAIRLPRGEWAHAVLLGFNAHQRRTFCRFWIAWSGEYDLSANDRISERTGQFQADLESAPDVLLLARTPLILGVILGAWLSGVSLPDNEVDAYDRISSFLLEEHSKRRRHARGDLARPADLRLQHLKELIAEVALRIQEEHAAGFIQVDAAERVLAGLLEDRLGRPRHDARVLAADLIAFFRGDVGLVVERAPDLFGFSLPVLQEYWAAAAIARRDVDAQEVLVARFGLDPRWRHVLSLLLGIHGILRADASATARLVAAWMASASTEEQGWRVLAWLAGPVLGGLRISPTTQRELASKIIAGVNTAPFKALRVGLARSLPAGLREGAIAADVGRALPSMLFARTVYLRRRLVEAFGRWAPADDLKTALYVAMRDDDEACRMRAAESVAHVFQRDTGVARYCWEAAQQGIDSRLRHSALVAAVTWPGFGDVDTLLGEAAHESDPVFRFTAIKARVALGRQAPDDWKVLLAFTGLWSLLPYELQSEIPGLLARGWPGSREIRDAALAAVRRGRGYSDGSDALDFDSATAALLRAYPTDPEVGQWLVAALRDPHGGFPLVIRQGALAGFKGTPGLDNVLLDRMRQDETWIHTRLIDWVGAASSREIRDLLKERLANAAGIEAYWVAAALLASWADDPDVVGCVRKRVFDRPCNAGHFAWHLPLVVPDVEERRSLLLRWLRDPEVARPEAVVDEALSLPGAATDEAIVEEAVRRLEHEPQNMYGRKRILEKLIATVPMHASVRSAALRDLDDPEAGLDTLATAYQDDPEFRPRLISAVLASELDVREAIITRVRPPISRQVDPNVLLHGTWIETEGGIRMRGVLAHARCVRAGGERDALIEHLRHEALVLGMHYAERRSAAATGMLALNAEGVLRSLIERGGRPLRIDLRSRDEDIRPLVRLLLADWPKHRELIGPERPILTDWKQFWESAEPVLDEYPEAIPDAQAHVREHRGPASVALMRLMSRVLSDSSVLLNTCIETIRSHQVGFPDMLHAARTLGDQFGGDSAVERRLDELRRASEPWGSSGWAIALAYGWPESPILRHAFPARTRVDIALFFHLDRVLNHGAEHVATLERIVLRGHGGRGNNPYVVAEIVESFRRCAVRDAAFPDRLFPWLSADNDSKRISAMTLLRALGWASDNVTAVVSNIFAAATTPGGALHTGYDVASNSVRTAAEVAWDYLYEESLRQEAHA